MISDYDKKYNRVSKLDRSKWTSLKRLHGWKHYEVVNVDKKNDKIELFAICEKKKRVFVKKDDLKNKKIWIRGWNSKMNENNDSSIIDQLIDDTISDS